MSLETAVLLRVPPPVAEQLHKQLQAKESSAAAAGASGKEERGPSVKLHFHGGASGAVSLQAGSAQLSGQLVNLPSVIEVHKTFHSDMYYKVTDIGQMIVVQAAAAAAPAAPSLNANPARPKVGAAGDAAAAAQPLPPVDYPHGLTPPTREIRTKRYERNTKPPVSAWGQGEKGQAKGGGCLPARTDILSI